MPKKNKSKQKKKHNKKALNEREDSSSNIEEENTNPTKDNITIKEIKNEKHSQISFINNHDLSFLEYYQKQITGDGNCYYRCLSYYYRGTEDYHLEFRQLISELFENNLDKFISSYPDPDILGEKEPENEEEILNFLKNMQIISRSQKFMREIRK